MKRSEELQQFSIMASLPYAERIDKLPRFIIDNEFLLFSSFHYDKNNVLPTCFKNILAGNLNGFEIFLSDFRSDYSVDRNAFGYKQTIAVLRSPDFSFPTFSLMPKRAERFTIKLDHIGQNFFMPIFRGYKKIQLSEFPGLSNKYVLKARGAHVYQECLTVPLVQYLESHSKWFIEGSQDALLIYRRGVITKPSDIHEYIRNIVEIGELLAIKLKKSYG